MALVRHAISRNHLIKMLNDFMVTKSLKVRHQSTKFGSHRNCGSGDVLVLVHHVIS